MMLKLLLIFILFIIESLKFQNNTTICKHDNKHKLKKIIKENEINFQTGHFWNESYLKNEMNTYGLYDKFKIPQLSLILMYNKTHDHNLSQLFQRIHSILCNNSLNIEIILLCNFKDDNDYTMVSKHYQKYIKNKIINIYNTNYNAIKDFYNIINLLKGFFTIFIENINLLNYLKFENIFNLTKGKINNYFNLTMPFGNNIYLIKTKLLKDIIDNGVEITSFKLIVNKIIIYPNPQLNYIPISLCPDNHFTNLAYVAMSSILSSKAIIAFFCISEIFLIHLFVFT